MDHCNNCNNYCSGFIGQGEKGVKGDKGDQGLMTMEQVEQYLIANDYITQEKLHEKLQDGTVEIKADTIEAVREIKADIIEAVSKIKTDIIEASTIPDHGVGTIKLEGHINVGGRARINMEGKAGNDGDYLNVFTEHPNDDKPLFLVGKAKKSGMWEKTSGYCNNSSEC